MMPTHSSAVDTLLSRRRCAWFLQLTLPLPLSRLLPSSLRLAIWFVAGSFRALLSPPKPDASRRRIGSGRSLGPSATRRLLTRMRQRRGGPGRSNPALKTRDYLKKGCVPDSSVRLLLPQPFPSLEILVHGSMFNSKDTLSLVKCRYGITLD